MLRYQLFAVTKRWACRLEGKFIVSNELINDSINDLINDLINEPINDLIKW